MMRRSLFALAVVSVLSLPFSALAEAPQSVTGLNAEAQEDGTIQVRWTPVGGEVSAYRVYFSQKSILENDGYYDDVETTEGPVSEYVLRSVPSSLTTIFVSVMAVNAQGEESQYFIEEVQVQRSMGQPMNEPPASLPEPAPVSSVPQQQIPPSAQEPSGNTLHLLSAQALSATRVGLGFSATPIIEPSLAPSAFSIVDAAGAPLAIEQLTIEGKNVSVQTVRQVAGAVYQIRLNEPLAGEGMIPLDRLDRTAFFTGHSTGLTPQEGAARAVEQEVTAPATSLPQQPGQLPDVLNFRLQASPQNSQLFTVIGQWEYDPSTPEGAFIVVRQSRDGGRTFSVPEFLPGDLDGVKIPNVTPQNFGIVVYVADAEGRSSPGVFRSIFGWNTPQVAPPPTATVTPPASAQSSAPASTVTAPPTPKAKSLSQTGAGAIAGLAALGAFLGWKKTRKAR